MKILFLPLLVLAASVGMRLRSAAPCCGDAAADACCAEDAAACCEAEGPLAAAPVHGEYLEARDATVWGGACHTNAEVLGQGREALLAWSLTAGEHDGVSLAGARLVAAVHGDGNLAQAAARRAVVFVDAASGAQHAAAVAWLREHHGAALGELTDVRGEAVEFELTDDGYRLRAGDAVELAGSPVPDGACCTMPEQRWYAPLDTAVAESRVGCPETCRVDGVEGLVSWSHTGQNNVQFGRF